MQIVINLDRLPNWARYTLGATVPAVALLAVAFASAAPKHEFAAGTPISAADMNDNFVDIDARVTQNFNTLDQRVTSIETVGGSEHSGSRLKLQTYLGPDGAVIHTRLLTDTMLGVTCLLGRESDGTARCFPYFDAAGTYTLSTQVGYFSDSACTNNVAGRSTSLGAPAYVLEQGDSGGFFDDGAVTGSVVLAAYTVGANLGELSAIYALDNSATCISFSSSGLTYYELGASLPLSTFEAVTLVGTP